MKCLFSIPVLVINSGSNKIIEKKNDADKGSQALQNETKFVTEVGQEQNKMERMMMNLKNNKMMQSVIMMAILMTGLVFVTTRSAISQEICKSAEKLTQDTASTSELDAQRNCWIRKMKSDAPNLSGAYLKGVNLSKMDLSGWNLTRTDLSGANLEAANLSFANLNWANLSGADLDGADLTDASLILADLSNASLKGTVSSGANLKDVKIAENEFIVRLRLKNMVCTFSDDEGSNNNTEMGFFNITANKIVLYNWKAKIENNSYGVVTTSKGSNWKVNREILFSERNRSGIVFYFNGEAHEYDFLDFPPSANETGENSSTWSVGKEDRLGFYRHQFTISSADFSFDINIEAEIIASVKL